MNHQLNFVVKYIYKSLDIGITLKTTLHSGSSSTICDAKIDTGSEFCLFARELGELLDLEIETGFEKKLITLSGGLKAFGHYVELETLGLKFDSFVYFAQDYSLNRNLLGRQGCN